MASRSLRIARLFGCKARVCSSHALRVAVCLRVFACNNAAVCPLDMYADSPFNSSFPIRYDCTSEVCMYHSSMTTHVGSRNKHFCFRIKPCAGMGRWTCLPVHPYKRVFLASPQLIGSELGCRLSDHHLHPLPVSPAVQGSEKPTKAPPESFVFFFFFSWPSAGPLLGSPPLYGVHHVVVAGGRPRLS